MAKSTFTKPKFQASKESAARALAALKIITNALTGDAMMRTADQVITVEKFIEAAGKKLPSVAAYNRDRIRKKDKPASKNPGTKSIGSMLGGI